MRTTASRTISVQQETATLEDQVSAHLLFGNHPHCALEPVLQILHTGFYVSCYCFGTVPELIILGTRVNLGAGMRRKQANNSPLCQTRLEPPSRTAFSCSMPATSPPCSQTNNVFEVQTTCTHSNAIQSNGHQWSTTTINVHLRYSTMKSTCTRAAAALFAVPDWGVGGLSVSYSVQKVCFN